MSTIIRFKRHLRSEVIPGDGVYLVSERSKQSRLQGRLAEQLAPLLAGKHGREEVVAALAAEYAPERVGRALDVLTSAGHLVETDASVDPRAAGYWETAGLDGDLAVRAVSERPVEVLGVGDVRVDWLMDAAAVTGLRIGDASAPLSVVVTDDYLRPELAELNRESIARDRAWLPVKPVGTLIWVGPLFVPGQTGCWQCLASRLSGNRMVASYLGQRTGQAVPLITSVADLPVTVEIGARLAVLEAARWLAGQPPTGEVFTLDTLTMTATRHRLTRRPQCPACGDPSIQAARQREPVVLSSRPKLVVDGGGHRAKSPEQLIADYEHLVSPITGPITGLIKVDSPDGLHTYTAGQNFAIPMADVRDLRAGLRSMSAGKGMSDTQAKAGAIAEAIERYSGLFHGDEARRTASYDELGDVAIAPNELHLYSERQLADRAEWNQRPSHFHRVVDPFDPTDRIEWTPVWSLTQQRHRYLPTGTLFFGYSMRRGRMYTGADSNGNAAGSCLEDAALQGFMELVERDSVAIWWYNRVRRPAVDLESFGEPYFLRWRERYRALGRETWLLDLTTDLGVPTVAAISRRIDKPVEDILLAFGSHFDMKVAVSRAITEMNQFLPAVLPLRADGTGEYAYPDPDQRAWWTTATLANQPYLRPSEERPRTPADYPDPSSDDLREDLLRAQRLVESRGLEMLMLDQTRPDIGLPVVKVIVPGLRHFWPRYAPGRLYDVPAQLGWLPAPLTEDELNPIGMFL
ncbi:TOMM precursor leader peptide-binding protein [Nonomuraea sp. NPDC000554]|uniref:TOMM precursor leader peptide-binding protein n=1 Tax=Nonomuraea sp. NPDC000554 TaxID=3154259 RepID=UPI0033314C3C